MTLNIFDFLTDIWNLAPFLFVDKLKLYWQLDLHISRISRENGKWFCETFLARNAAREIARKIDQNLANFDPKLAKIWAIFKVEWLQLSWSYYANCFLWLFELLIRFNYVPLIILSKWNKIIFNKNMSFVRNSTFTFIGCKSALKIAHIR